MAVTETPRKRREGKEDTCAGKMAVVVVPDDDDAVVVVGYAAVVDEVEADD